MKLSEVELLMYNLIINPEIDINLYDFYDDSMIQEICDKYPKYYDAFINIDAKNIVMVAAALMKSHNLPANEIWYLVQYICSHYDQSLQDDNDFAVAYSSICTKIKTDINKLDSKIKRTRNQAMEMDDQELIDRNEQIAKEVVSNEAIIKDSINELKECLKPKIDFQPRKGLNKKYKLQKKQQKQQGTYKNEPSETAEAFSELNKLSNMVDNKSKKDDEILYEIKRITQKYNLHKTSYHNVIKTIIKKLNERKENDVIIYCEIQDNITDLKNDYKSYIYLTDEEIMELKNCKKILSDAWSLLKKAEEVIELTDEERKRKININIFSQKRINVDESERVMQINAEKNFISSEEVLAETVIHKKTLQASDIDDIKFQELISNITHMLFDYSSSQQPKELFSFNNNEYYTDYSKKDSNKRHYLIKHAYSVEQIDGYTIIRIHVVNEYPYTSKNVKNFMDDFFGRSILKAYNPASGKYEYKKELELAKLKKTEEKIKIYEDLGSRYEESDEERERREYFGHINDVQRLISNTVSFRKGKIQPTIAYTFVFDSNNILQEKLFKIEALDGTLYSDTKENGVIYDNPDNPPEQIDILNSLFEKYNSNNKYENVEDFFEKILKKLLINYILINKLPVIFYGKYNKDEDYYDEMKDKGKELLGSDVIEFTSPMQDLDNSVLDKAYFAWYQNFKNKHFSLEYRSDCNYNLSDLGALKPESFLGYNFQKVINKCVFSKSSPGMPVYDELVNSQKRYIDKFNKACGYVSLEEFINNLGEVDPDEKGRGSK